MRGKALSLGQSVLSSASTVRYPHEERPKFLTCQKFIRPSDCLSGETYRFSFPPVHCTNTARRTTHDKAEIWHDSKNSRTSQNSAQNRTKIAQCMPGFTGLASSRPREFIESQLPRMQVRNLRRVNCPNVGHFLHFGFLWHIAMCSQNIKYKYKWKMQITHS